MKIVTAQETIQVDALDPDPALVKGYEQAKRLQAMISSSPEIQAIRDAGENWVPKFCQQGDKAFRRRLVTEVRAFLGGARLDEADQVFWEKYAPQLEAPAARAALALLLVLGDEAHLTTAAVFPEGSVPRLNSDSTGLLFRALAQERVS